MMLVNNTIKKSKTERRFINEPKFGHTNAVLANYWWAI